MDAYHEDERVRQMLAPLNRIEPVTLRRKWRRRRRPLLLVAAAGVVLLALTGAAIGAGMGPFAGITAAEHPATPSDVVGPDVVAQLRNDELPGTPIDQIGVHRIDSSRLVGTLPSGRKVYVVGTTKGRLCVIVVHIAESCGNPLTMDAPITFTTFVRGGPSGDPSYAWGVAQDGVMAVSFTVAGRHVTVPVRHNFFAYEGLPSDKTGDFSTATVTFADGHTAIAK